MSLIIKKNTTFKIPRTGASFLPSSLGGLSLWLKADAGTTTVAEQFISQVVISGGGRSAMNGTYTRASGGDTSFVKTGDSNFEILWSGVEWYINGDEYYCEPDDSNQTEYAYNPSYDMSSNWLISVEYGCDGTPPTGSLTLSPTGNTLVTAWADQSGNGKNATAIQFPTYSASAINSKPALVFANNAYLTTSNIFNGSNPRTMFAVYYIDSEQYSNTVCCQSNEDNTDIGTYFMLQSRIDLDSSPYLAGYSDDLSGPPYVNQQLLLGMADYDGTTARLFKNGAQANSEAKTYDTFTGEFHIGAFNEAGNIMEKFGGKIAEIVVYNRILTTPERQQVEAYLNSKYQIY